MQATQYALGLVVGKFAPLHAGHLHLIERAASECESLLILSWAQPEIPGCSAEARRRWLADCVAHESVVIDESSLAALCRERGIVPERIPADASSDSHQQRFLAWLVHEVLQRRPNAMFASEHYVEPSARMLAHALQQPVTPVMVDPQRRAVPISASLIRSDPVGHGDFLPAAVRRDWIARVCLLGGESSGKTTLARALAQAHGEPCVEEYGRELWEQQDGRLAEADLPRIARTQIDREDAAARTATRLIFCDTSPLTTLFYAQAMFGRSSADLLRCAERHYDRTLLCAPDFPFVQDGTRQDAAFRQRQHAWYLEELRRRGVPHLVLSGSLPERIATAAAALRPASAHALLR